MSHSVWLIHEKTYIFPKIRSGPTILEKCSFQFQGKWSIENSKWKLNHVIFENFDVKIPTGSISIDSFRISKFRKFSYKYFKIFFEKCSKNDSFHPSVATWKTKFLSDRTLKIIFSKITFHKKIFGLIAEFIPRKQTKNFGIPSNKIWNQPIRKKRILKISGIFSQILSQKFLRCELLKIKENHYFLIIVIIHENICRWRYGANVWIWSLEFKRI